jgi:hypothetical protein
LEIYVKAEEFLMTLRGYQLIKNILPGGSGCDAAEGLKAVTHNNIHTYKWNFFHNSTEKLDFSDF